MDIVGTYSYLQEPSCVSGIIILSMRVKMGLLGFAYYIGVKVVQVCNIYIKEYKRDKKDWE